MRDKKVTLVVRHRRWIDETSLSDGELYTVEHDAVGSQGTVTEITPDLSSSMRKIARLSFPKATQVIDRFHVQKLALEALQEMRIDFRWDAIHEENKLMAEYRVALKRGEDVEPYEPPVYANGDTRKQLLARSRYLLFKSREK